MSRDKFTRDHSDFVFKDEERAFLEDHLPTLPHPVARDFFDAAKWVTERVGHFLTLEGEENGRLIYLLEGAVAITLKGQVIGRCEAGNFVGEMTALDGGPATASAMLVAETRYFAIGSADLKRLCMANLDLRLSLERAMMLDTRKKLLASNEVLRQT